MECSGAMEWSVIFTFTCMSVTGSKLLQSTGIDRFSYLLHQKADKSISIRQFSERGQFYFFVY